jgi:hypothetical protein
MPRLSDRDFKAFKATCLHWIEAFGLKDWEVSIEFSDDNPDMRAWCTASVMETRIAVLGLTRTWSYKPSQDELRRCAFHEVLELLLMPIRLRVMDIPGVDSRVLDEEAHRVIRILENSIKH